MWTPAAVFGVSEGVPYHRRMGLLVLRMALLVLRMALCSIATAACAGPSKVTAMAAVDGMAKGLIHMFSMTCCTAEIKTWTTVSVHGMLRYSLTWHSDSC